MAIADTLGAVPEEQKQPKGAREVEISLPPSFLDKLNDYLAAVPNDIREGLHVTSVWGLCPRQEFLRTIRPKDVAEEKISAGLRLTFDVGKAYHKLVQDQYMPEIAKMFGLEYVCEASLESAEVGIVGSSDIGMSKDRRAVVLELKTMNGDMYSRLRDALPEHVFQAEVYMWLWNECHPDLVEKYGHADWALVIYFDKNRQISRGGEVNAKEFPIPYRPDVGEQLRKKLLFRKKAFETAAQAGVSTSEEAQKIVSEFMAERDTLCMVCSSITDNRARKCPWAHECHFGL